MERIERAFDVRVIEGDEQGYFEGYASAFGVLDSYQTVFDRGCFKKTVKERKGRVPIAWMHSAWEPIGLAVVSEDDNGLFVKGQLDLDVQRGREVYSGMKKGYITQMSHAFNSIKERIVDGILHFKEVRLNEVSPVTTNFAANDQAAILSVRTSERGVISSNLSLASKDLAWDAGAANKRVQEWAKNADGDVVMSKYARAFLWVDGDGENLTDYKFPIGDIVDGTLKAVPRAIYAAAARIDQVKDVDVVGIKAQLAKYYEKLGETAPWQRIISVEAAFQMGRLATLLEPPVGTQEPLRKPDDHLRTLQREMARIERVITGA